MKTSDRFLKLVEWSEEDGCYIGSAPGFLGPCCHGKDEAKVYAELCKILDEWADIYREDGVPLPDSFGNKSFSGKFVVRVGHDLHKALAIKAAQSGESLNHFCKKLLSKTVARQTRGANEKT